jgi:acyl-coenzyme A thioesterase PaaI-like protein
MSNFLDLYKKFLRLPFGQFAFDRGIGFVAPFFATIKPRVRRLEPSLCVVEMKDRRAVRNHLGSINAGALCTLAELTGGMAVDATIPAQLRWIPRAMSVEYLAKAKGLITASCQLDQAIDREGAFPAPVEVRDAQNTLVFTAQITFHISRRKS